MPPAKRAKKRTPSSQLHRRFSPKEAHSEKDREKQETQETKPQQHKDTTRPISPPEDASVSLNPSLLDEAEVVPGLSYPDTDADASTKPTSPTEPEHSSHHRGGGSGGYNALKTFKGQVYTGMAVGGSHTWEYQPGLWHETKEEPDLWKIDYRATKRRVGRRRAPQGTGAAVGTEYHWFIVAHQFVRKLDANTYETRMAGSKYKLAYRRAGAGGWSVPSVKGQREREVELLKDAGRRVRGLPPVLAGEKVRVEKREKGQQRLDMLFGAGKGGVGVGVEGAKRKRKDDDGSDNDGVADDIAMDDISEEG
ncbi:conserved hypothetical protein [Histoplasma capsulatum G186AR]|uniref:Uncharacterized protein n=1 Tax=Ajellomyces capsulatus (strain G186AR / H82 / ATCC MYA-2454 / RMSCC 2432) TaxID=447093 RepID=C0NY85_AJECG|nr:uncharacterized protein HCBG_07879 [Histoplasma capsulatum G186AR]EEH03753.1 conserved hypothetical protein [Histoplasma capsulatum G186AR]